MLKLEIGGRTRQLDGFTPIDFVGYPNVLFQQALASLPFDDASAGHIYCAHCVQQIDPLHLVDFFREITRVAADDGVIEIWHPHFAHGDAYVLGQNSRLSEALYDHFGCTYRSFWRNSFGGSQWILQEVRYGIDGFVREDIRNSGGDIEFAISYFKDVIKEIGVFIQIDRTGIAGPDSYRRSICAPGNRQDVTLQLLDGPRRESLAARRSHGDLTFGAADA